MTLEELLQKFASALELERRSNWVLGDICVEGVKLFGKEIISKFAETARCSKERIKQLVAVSYTFPDSHRYPDVPWSFYRKVYQTAKRVNENAIELLETALSNGWSEKELAGYKLDKLVKAKFKAKCGVCGCKVTVEGDLKAGISIYCPVCSAFGTQTLLFVTEEENKLAVCGS